MKKINLLICFIILWTAPGWAEDCFLAKENGKVLICEGDCNTSYAPESTFKIPLSLMGFDSGILLDEDHPSWSLPDGVDPYINVCKCDHTPRMWMRDSCVWYSRTLVTKLGMKKFQDYVVQFSYGNKDLSGGLIGAWLSSSLKISAEEQALFLQKVLDRKFSISQASYDMTKKVMFVQEMSGGWNLYGKTGNGRLLDQAGERTELQHGWFVGYIEKGSRRVVFVCHETDSKKEGTFASFRARNKALIKLWSLIETLEK